MDNEMQCVMWCFWHSNSNDIWKSKWKIKKNISELTNMKIKCNSKINKIYVISNRWNIHGWWYWVRWSWGPYSLAGGHRQYRFYTNCDPGFITSRVVLIYFLLNFICYKLNVNFTTIIFVSVFLSLIPNWISRSFSPVEVFHLYNIFQVSCHASLFVHLLLCSGIHGPKPHLDFWVSS